MSQEIIPHAEWAAMEPEQRLNRLLGMTTDRCLEYLSVPATERMDAVWRNNQMQAMRAVLHTCTKLGIESQRLNAMRDKVIGDLVEGFDARAEETAAKGK